MAETERLAYFTVVHALDLNSFHNSSSSSSNSRNLQTEQCLQSCVVKMLERHSMVFSGMMQRLHIDRSVKFREGFCEIAEELFKDEVTWSKIVALFAFGARLAQHCREHHMEDLVEDNILPGEKGEKAKLHVVTALWTETPNPQGAPTGAGQWIVKFRCLANTAYFIRDMN